MERLTFRLELVTPCFLGGAAGTAEWRTASIRGQFRWWFRAVAGAAFQGELEPVRRAEGDLFGSIQKQSSIRIQALTSPPAKRDGFPFGSLLAAEGLAKLWGDSSAATRDRLRLGRGDIASNPLQYLGFGPIVSGQLERPYLSPESEVAFVLWWHRKPAEDQKTLFDLTLWAWIHLGGIGSRSRKGFGSLSYPSYPTREELKAQARSLLSLGAGNAVPEWTHFSERSRIVIGSDEESWEDALVRLGAWMMAFRRRYGYPGDTRPDGRGGTLAGRDYEWAAPRGQHGREGIPDRAGFGLPLPFGQREQIVWNTPDKDPRRASPLLLHVARLGGTFVPVLTYLPARFLPPGGGLMFKGNGSTPKAPPAPLQLDIVDRFLDDLLSKKLVEEVRP